MRAFRLAVPCSDLDRSVQFFEDVLAVEADRTVPSRPYLHCDGFIVALIDTAVEDPSGSPPRALPDDLYFSTGDLDATHARAIEAGPALGGIVARRGAPPVSFSSA